MNKVIKKTVDREVKDILKKENKKKKRMTKKEEKQFRSLYRDETEVYLEYNFVTDGYFQLNDIVNDYQCISVSQTEEFIHPECYRINVEYTFKRLNIPKKRINKKVKENKL